MTFKKLKNGILTWSSKTGKQYRIEAKTRAAWNADTTYWLLTHKENDKWIIVGMFINEELAKKWAVDHHNAAIAAQSN